MSLRGLTLALTLFGTLSSAAFAQQGDSVRRPARPRAAAARAEAREARVEARAAGRAGRAGQAGAPVAKNQALARQVRQAFAGVVRRQLALTDDQARRLQETDQRFQQQRNDLQRQEKSARVGLRAALQKQGSSGGKDDQAEVARYMDQLVQAQHRRAEVLDAEQKELSGFLTPVQRAKYQALREQLNLRVRALQQPSAAAADSTKR